MTVNELNTEIEKLKAARNDVLNKGADVRVNRSDGITRADLEELNKEINKLEVRLAFQSKRKGRIF